MSFSKYSLTPTEGLSSHVYDPDTSEGNLARKATSSGNVQTTEKRNKD